MGAVHEWLGASLVVVVAVSNLHAIYTLGNLSFLVYGKDDMDEPDRS